MFNFQTKQLCLSSLFFIFSHDSACYFKEAVIYTASIYTDCNICILPEVQWIVSMKGWIYNCKKPFRVHPEYIVTYYIAAWIQSKVYLVVI